MKPRLLLVVTLAEAGGAQTFVLALARGMQDRYEMHVAAHGPDGALVDGCRELGIEFHHIANLVRDLDPRRDAAAVRELRQLARRINPALVQLNSSKAGVLARFALAGTGIPVIFTAHGWAFSGRGGKAGAVYANAERAAAPFCRAIVCVSNWDLQLAIDRRITKRSKLSVIHNGVDIPPDLPMRRPAGDPLVLGCTARLFPPKDIVTMLEALKRPEAAAWSLRVFGDGPDRELILARRAELGLEDRATFLGNRSDVPKQLLDCDAFSLISDWEGLPYSILEAMAHGLPVIATRVGGIPDLVVPGETGALIPPRNPAALAVELAKLSADRSLLASQGAAGYARAADAFSIGHMVDQYEALFQRVL